MEFDNTLAATAGRVTGTEPGGGSYEVLAQGVKIGRYSIVARLGSGAMGVVYAAHDPELDRRIALKLVLPDAQRDPAEVERVRLLREAQALAKLSHPNVVAVHDMGTHGDRVWIAMELVSGLTLRAWAERRPRRWSESLRVLRDVARGVAAAHAAGLVHRDLKPDNVMIDSDGRVRVMDFGLARGRASSTTMPEPVHPSTPASAAELDALALRLTRVGALQGTPAYMAPEQWKGDEATPAVDQFAWSVTAWELLYGERPFAGTTLMNLGATVTAGRLRPPPRGRRVPGWLRQVVERGLASDPARRFPTMTALLAALERGRSRARVRTAAVVFVAVALMIAAVVGYRWWDHARRLAGCAATAADLDAAWNDGVRDQLRAAFLATALPDAGWTADRTTRWLDEYATEWKWSRAAACVRTEVEGSWDEDTLARSTWCLTDRRVTFTSLVAELSRADPTSVQKAITAAAALRSVDTCLDADLLRRSPTPPTDDREEVQRLRAELARADSLGLAGRFEAGLKAAEPARARAEALAWPPLTAAARACEGALLMGMGTLDRAEVADKAAYFAAARSGAWDVAADAANDLVFIVGYKQHRAEEGRAWSQHAEVAAEHAGDPGRLRRARRLNSMAAVHFAAGDYATARGAYEEALAIREASLGPHHPDVAATLSNLAMMNRSTGAVEAAKVQAERALLLTESLLGPGHPDVAAALQNVGHVLFESGKPAEARRLYERGLMVQEAALGPAHPAVAESLSNIASAATRMGEPATAADLHERALTIKEAALGRDHPDVAITLNGLANAYLALKAYARAKSYFERALAIWTRVSGPEHPDVARVLGNLADVYAATGDPAKALELVAKSLAIKEKVLGRDHPSVAISLASLGHLHVGQNRPLDALPSLERAVVIYEATAGRQFLEAQAHFDLARALLAAAGDHTRAVAEARVAQEQFRDTGAAAKAELTEVEAWLAVHAGTP